MAVIASALIATQMQGLDWPPAPPEPRLWLLLPLFAIAEVLVVHLPTLRSAYSHTLREVPAVAGLAFLSPGGYFTAYVVGAGLALLIARSQRGVKLLFNISMFALEAAIGLLIYRWVLGTADVADPRGWLAAFAAVLVTDVTSAIAVSGAISLTEDRLETDTLREAVTGGLVAAMVNTCMALLVVVLAVNEPTALPLLGAVLLMLVFAYRAYVSLGTGYARLQMLYRFVGSTRQSTDLDDSIGHLLAEARDLLRAGVAELIVLPTAEEPGSRTTLVGSAKPVRRHYDQPDAGRDAWWAPAVLGDSVLKTYATARRRDRSPPSSHTTREASDLTARDGIAAPLRTDGHVEAVILVVNRTFEAETFSAEDLRLFETLAAHAAVALGKARLVDRLQRLADQRDREAHHDSLTGLPNRRAFLEAVAEVRMAGSTAAVLLIDLDDFKDVNDTLGHTAGDVLLRDVGERLQAAVNGVVARLGGDEFAVLLADVSHGRALEQAQDVRASLAQPVQLQDVNLLVNASVGVAMLPHHGTEADELLQHADVAMYRAKGARSGVEMYRSEDDRAVHRRLALAGDLPHAVREHAFEIFYQPQADASTGRIVAVEALLRWTHPLYNAIPAPEVVALAERTGMLRQLTDAILEDALHQRSSWVALGHDLTISINVTARDLSDGDLPAVVDRLLNATGTPAPALTVEITESGVMSDPARCLSVLGELSALDVRLSIDDFGTGHSSLAYLERLPVHEVKIDKSFVQRLERQASDATVVRATIALAHDLGMRVVAEGIESQVAWTRVADLGCEIVQGYWIARPMSGQRIVSWLDSAGGGRRDPLTAQAPGRSTA